MTDREKTKEELLVELGELRARVAESEALEAELRQIRDRLHQSEKRFDDLSNAAGEIIWTASLDGSQLTYINPAAEQVYGRPRHEFIENPALWFEVIHPEDKETAENGARRLLETGHREIEYRILRPDGGVRWILDRARTIQDDNGQPAGIGGIATDITERRRVERNLADERQLLRKLLRLQEQERKLVALEIHDGFVQHVFGAQMLLEALLADQKLQVGPLPDQLNAIGRSLRIAAAEARRMISELRPIILDEQGIVETINFLAAKEQEAGTLKIRFEHDVHFGRLDPILEGTVFRIVQEALTNVKRHSRSETVDIDLRQEGEFLRLAIRDQGIGFNPRQMLGSRFGIRGMRERARLFGGRTTIDSSPGNGTTVTVELPIRLESEYPLADRTG